MKKPNTTPASPSVIKPVYSWEVFTEVSNADSFTACDVVGYIYGNRRCNGDQTAFLLSNGVVVDFQEVSAHHHESGEYIRSSTEEEDAAIECWVIDNSVRTLSSLHQPKSMVDTALLLAHCAGGVEVTLTQEKGMPPFSYRLLGEVENYLPPAFARTLPSTVRIKLRNLWQGSDEGYISYFDKRDLTLLKKWLAVR